jgi:hypothetical protein
VEEEFLTRAYERGDETAILGLFHKVFHTGRTLEHWRWKYLENPLRNGCISLTFAQDGTLVAHYAGYGTRWIDARHSKPRALEALQIGDTMTAPGYRHVGRGPTSLLGRTVAHFYATFCTHQVAFNYGFNTANIQKFSLRFVNAHRAEAIGYWVCDRPQPLRSRRFPFSRYRAAPFAAADERWDELFHRVAHGYGVLACRDQAAVRWRFLNCPDPGLRPWAAWRGSKLVAWAVFRRDGENLCWGDSLVDPEHPGAARELLRAALAQEEPAPASLSAWFPPRPGRWARWLEDHGFRRRREPNDLALMCVPFLEPDCEDVLRASYYAQGDGDLF